MRLQLLKTIPLFITVMLFGVYVPLAYVQAGDNKTKLSQDQIDEFHRVLSDFQNDLRILRSLRSVWSVQPLLIGTTNESTIVNKRNQTFRSSKVMGWDGGWDGTASPNETNVPYHLWFDNPHDDDLDASTLVEGSCKFRFDDPQVGMLTVDRLKQPNGRPCLVNPVSGLGGRNFTGSISRRDEWLTDVGSKGLTIEFRAQVPNYRTKSQFDAVSLAFFGTDGTFGLFLSPACAKFGRVSRGTIGDCTGNAVKIDATSMNTYRVIYDPNTQKVNLYMNGDGQAILTGVIEKRMFVRNPKPGETTTTGDTGYNFPMILFGDNVSNFKNPADIVAANNDTSAAYTLDYLVYSKGVIKNGDVKTSLYNREASPLPQLKTRFSHSLRGDTQIVLGKRKDVGNVIRTSSDIKIVNDSDKENVLHFTNAANIRVETLEGLTGNGTWQMKLTAKVKPEHTSRSFVLRLTDHVGTIDFALSNDRVELLIGSKFKGISQPYKMDTTDRYHTYTLIRPYDSPYVYLYIDENPIPVIYDFKMSAAQFNRANEKIVNRLTIGALPVILPESYVRQPDGQYTPVYPKKNQSVLVESLEWVGQ